MNYGRPVVAVTIVSAALLASSCSGGGSELVSGSGTDVVISTVTETENRLPEQPDTQPDGASDVDSAADAFHFDSGELRIGDFDPLEVYPDVFDPCQEISREEFAELGYTTDGITSPRAQGSALACTLIPNADKPQLVTVVLGNLVTQEEIRAQAEFHELGKSEILPTAIVYSTVGDERTNCRAAVPTERGQLSVAIGQAFKPTDFDHLCQEAIDLLERFLEV